MGTGCTKISTVSRNEVQTLTSSSTYTMASVPWIVCCFCPMQVTSQDFWLHCYNNPMHVRWLLYSYSIVIKNDVDWVESSQFELSRYWWKRGMTCPQTRQQSRCSRSATVVEAVTAWHQAVFLLHVYQEDLTSLKQTPKQLKLIWGFSKTHSLSTLHVMQWIGQIPKPNHKKEKENIKMLIDWYLLWINTTKPSFLPF